MIAIASIPSLESQLEVDRGELVKVRAEQTKPNIDAASLAAGRAAFRAKYEGVQQAKAQEAQRQAETLQRNAQRLLADKRLKEQQQKQVREMNRDRGSDISR